MGELLNLIKQEVEAREVSEQVKIHAMKPHSGVTIEVPITQLAHLFQIIRFIVCTVMDLTILYHSKRFQTFENVRTYCFKTAECFNCLKTSHKLRDCDSHILCRHCHRKHDQSICSGAKESDNPPSPSTQAPAQVESTQSASEGIFTTNNTTSSCKKQPTVLLQTAQAVASSAPGSSGVTVRILFNSGSQLSYFTERLRLKQVKIEKLHLNMSAHATIQDSRVKCC